MKERERNDRRAFGSLTFYQENYWVKNQVTLMFT